MKNYTAQEIREERRAKEEKKQKKFLLKQERAILKASRTIRRFKLNKKALPKRLFRDIYCLEHYLKNHGTTEGFSIGFVKHKCFLYL